MHLLQQHTFDIQCSSQSFGKEIQNQLSALLEKDFYPKLEILLDKYTVKNHAWNIDLMELELSSVSKKNWKNELISHSLLQIEEYLKNNVPLSRVNKKHVIENESFVINEQYLSFLLFNYLKTGVLLENSVSKDLDEILNGIEITTEFLQKLFNNFEHETIYLERWILSIPIFFKEKVIDSLIAFKKITVPNINKIILSQRFNSLEIKKLKQFFFYEKELVPQWIELLQWINYIQQKSSSKQIIFERFIQLSASYWNISLDHMKQFFKIISTNNKTEFEQALNEINIFLQTCSKSASLNILNNDFSDIAKKSADITKSKANAINTNDTINIDRIQFISNAGLVILHPFLNSLFEQLELCEKEIWKSKKSQHKAILLSQFLITGQEKMYENELVLNKILCGLPTDSVVNTNLKFTKKEKEKCKSLLEAVLEYWKTMSKSSIEALQQTFLQREGKLEIQTNGFELWVEEKGYDILLDQLPWGIGMVKTPWMEEEYLTCNWN
jgi:Contractile injection system tape measure protein